MKAVILAGGVASEALASVAGERRKGLIPLGGRPAVSYVVQALRGAEIERVALVGPDEIRPQASDCLWVPEGDGVADNLLAGIAALGCSGSSEPILVTPSDIPLLRERDVRSFLERVPSAVGAAASFVRKERVQYEQPGAVYRYIRTKEGSFATGGLCLIRADIAERLIHLVQRLHTSRKSQLRVALMLGLPVLIKFKLGFLDIAGALRAVERLIGAGVWVDLEASPRTSLDLDGPEDFLYLREHWERLSGASDQ